MMKGNKNIQPSRWRMAKSRQNGRTSYWRINCTFPTRVHGGGLKTSEVTSRMSARSSVPSRLLVVLLSQKKMMLIAARNVQMKGVDIVLHSAKYITEALPVSDR